MSIYRGYASVRIVRGYIHYRVKLIVYRFGAVNTYAYKIFTLLQCLDELVAVLLQLLAVDIFDIIGGENLPLSHSPR